MEGGGCQPAAIFQPSSWTPPTGGGGIVTRNPAIWWPWPAPATSKFQPSSAAAGGQANTRDEEDMDRDEDEEDELPEREYGTIKAPAGTWASYIRIYDPLENTTHDMIELEDNQVGAPPGIVAWRDTASEGASVCLFGSVRVWCMGGGGKERVPDLAVCPFWRGDE